MVSSRGMEPAAETAAAAARTRWTRGAGRLCRRAVRVRLGARRRCVAAASAAARAAPSSRPRRFSSPTASSRSASAISTRTSATTPSIGSLRSPASSCSARVPAALINGLASFVYPWHRLWKGVPPRDVAYAALQQLGSHGLGDPRRRLGLRGARRPRAADGLDRLDDLGAARARARHAAPERRGHARAARARPAQSQRFLQRRSPMRSSLAPAPPRCSSR